MRRVRDRRLPDPFRAWIDRAAPLPAGLTLLPRTINVSGDVWALVCVALPCMGMGVPVTFMVARSELEFGGWAVFVLILLVMISAVTWLALRLWRTIGARRDLTAGTLRQGVFVGPEGVLVRLMPNRCYPIPLDRFVKAEEWSGGGSDGGEDYVKIETRDGRIDFVADHLTVDAAGVNQAVAAVRRSAGAIGRSAKR